MTSTTQATLNAMYQSKKLLLEKYYTAQKIKFSIKDYFSKCDQIYRKLGEITVFFAVYGIPISIFRVISRYQENKKISANEIRNVHVY